MLRILIVENDRMFAKDLANAIRKFPLEVVGVAFTAAEAIALLDTELPDLALVDIELDDNTSGITVAKHIQAYHQMPFIFLTDFIGSSNKYYKEALATNYTHYLPKGSFLPHQIWHFIETAMDIFGKQQEPEAAICEGQTCFIRNVFFAKSTKDNAYKKITVSDLKIMDVVRPYIKISTMQGVNYLTKFSLDHLMQQFNSPNLLQVNQSCAVHIQSVVSISKSDQTITLHDSTIKKIGREYSKQVQARLLLLP